MGLDVFAADEQDAVPLDLERWVGLAKEVLRSRGVRGDAEVALLYVDVDTMASLHEEHLGGRGPTDVLSFPIEDDPFAERRLVENERGRGGASELLLLGDVVICPAVARRNAAEHGGTLDDELALLLVHGLLHLLGMDHAEPVEAEAMERLERQLLGRFHRPATGVGRD